MYILKIKGKAKIPNYIQIRDEDFLLIAYFRADKAVTDLSKYGLGGKEEQISKIITSLPFGKLEKLN